MQKDKNSIIRLLELVDGVYINLDTSVSVVTTVGRVSAGAATPSSTGMFFGGVSGSVPVGAVETPAQDARDEEEDAVDDCEDPAGLEHGTRAVDASTPTVSTRVGFISKLNSNWDVKI